MINKKKVYNNIMRNITEVFADYDYEYNNDIKVKPMYVVECSYCDNTIMRKLDTFKIQYERTKNGIKVFCTSWDETIKATSIFEQFGAFEREALNGREYGTVKIYKWKSYVNDSVNEGRTVGETTNPKGETPKAHAKREAIREIQNGTLQRNEGVVKKYLLSTGLWDGVSDARLKLDIKFVMDKTNGWDQQIEGDFMTEFIYSKEYDNDRNIITPKEALNSFINFLDKNGLNVETKEGRFATKIYIHYNGKRQYEALVKWAMWALGYVDNIHNGGRAGEDREEVEEIIASGSSNTVY